MKTYVVTYGYPVLMSFIVNSEDGITASCGPEEELKSQGYNLDKVQCFVHRVYEPIIVL